MNIDSSLEISPADQVDSISSLDFLSGTKALLEEEFPAQKRGSSLKSDRRSTSLKGTRYPASNFTGMRNQTYGALASERLSALPRNTRSEVGGLNSCG